MNRTLRATLTALAVLGCAVSTAAAMSRIKDLASIEGVRQNQLFGYGLVVGLNGTGDTLNNTPFTKQSLQAMLERLGVNIRGQQIRTGNVIACVDPQHERWAHARLDALDEPPLPLTGGTKPMRRARTADPSGPGREGRRCERVVSCSRWSRRSCGTCSRRRCAP